jgi:hypothetical protein
MAVELLPPLDAAQVDPVRLLRPVSRVRGAACQNSGR